MGIMSLRHQLSAARYALLLALASPISAVVLHNITLALPDGSSDHGIPGLLCTPTRPLDLLTFYLLNYVAHAATVLTRPGERADDYVASVVGSLLFPALGLYRGIDAILCGALWVRNDNLRKAARSGALCLVVRDADWRPQDGEVIQHAIYRRPQATQEESGREGIELEDDPKDANSKREVHLIPFSPPYLFSRFGLPIFVHRRIIHGTHILPAGYRFAIVPHDAEFVPYQAQPQSPPLAPSPTRSPTLTTLTTLRRRLTTSAPAPSIEVSAPYNIIKALIALIQSAYALTTLYRSRGDQIARFGFAAFGLTVAPYAVMSIMNLVGNLCRPEYPSLYMVESSVMDEARARGGIFEGAVGKMQEGGEQVCACWTAEGLEVEDVRVVKSEDGELDIRFSTADQAAYERGHTIGVRDEATTNKATVKQETEKRTTAPGDSKAISIVTSEQVPASPSRAYSPPLLQHTYTLAPIPHKLNYTSTRHSALLLVPNHPPLIRGCLPSTSSDMPPSRSTLLSLELKRTYPLASHRTYIPKYMPSQTKSLNLRWRISKYLITTLIALIPVLLTGILSRFHPGNTISPNASTWRVFTLQWLGFGTLTGLWWVVDQEGKDAVPAAWGQVGPFSRVAGYVVSASPAVGGYIVVGQMLYAYNVCTWVGD